MDGTDKRPLLVIGKSKNPRCFRGVQQLPTPYKNNSNAWMTGDIFQDWLVSFEADMAKEDRNIVLVVDNCSAHPKHCADDLPHIKLVFFPPSVTSVIQPCDMGIIRNLKANYRRKVVSRVITHIEPNCDVTVSSIAKSITILDAMHMLKTAWPGKMCGSHLLSTVSARQALSALLVKMTCRNSLLMGCQVKILKPS